MDVIECEGVMEHVDGVAGGVILGVVGGGVGIVKKTYRGV